MSLVLCFLMIVNVLPVKTFAEEEQSLGEIIRPQVEAFAKSIDQKNADGKAQDILISHGISGGGKKLSVGKSSALTATIVNSELTKYYLTKVCGMLIETANERKSDKMYSVCGNIWKINSKNLYQIYIYDYDATNLYDSYGYVSVPNDYIKHVKRVEYDKSNVYDDSLELLAGETSIETNIKQIGIYEDKIVYEISNWVHDKFDFSAENGSALENLLGFIGMLLFEPFEWESKFNFRIEIPIEKPEENEVFGDMDGSGNVDVSDAYFARLVAAKLVEPTPEQLAFCDVDRDGKITAIDANLIRKFAAGIIKSLPIN